MAESEWRSYKSRVFAAYVSAAISGKIGAKRNEDVCREIVQRLGPKLGEEMSRVREKALASPYREFFLARLGDRA